MYSGLELCLSARYRTKQARIRSEGIGVAGIISGYRQSLTMFNRNIRTMLITFVLFSVGNGIGQVINNLYFLSIGLDEVFIGNRVFVTNLCLGLAILPAGLLADRADKSFLLKLGNVSWALFTSGILVTRNETALLVLASLQGLTLALALAPEMPFLSENCPPEARTHLFSLNMMIFTGISSLGAIAGGYLPRLFSGLTGVPYESPDAYRFGIWVSVACFWLGAFQILRLKRGPDLSQNITARKAPLKLVSPFSVIAAVSANFGVVAFGAAMFVPFMNVILKTRFKIPAHVIGWLFTLESAAICLGSLIAPRIAEVRGKAKSAVLFQALSLPIMMVMAITPYPALFIVGFVLRSGLMNMANPLIDSFAMESIDPAERGTVTGLLGLVRNSLYALGGRLGGMWLAAQQHSVPILVSMACYGVAIFLFYILAAKQEGAIRSELGLSEEELAPDLNIPAGE